jgi:hypothetical protein
MCQNIFQKGAALKAKRKWHGIYVATNMSMFNVE